MSWIFRASLIVLALALALAWPAAGPVTAGPAVPSLFPLVLNAEWTRKNDDNSLSTSKVTGPKTIGTVRCVVIERKFTFQGRERVERNCYLATATEVVLIETTSQRGEPQTLKPPRTLLKLPPKAGQTWSWSPEDPGVDLKITSKWIGEETLKVGAGQFKAWKIETITTGEDLDIKAYTWYAPGAGTIRNERNGHRGERKISGWTELVSYKIP